MALKIKLGRRASDEERKYVKDWVLLFKEAQKQPGERLCVNPEAPHEERTYFYATTDFLLKLLEQFSETGYFRSGNSYGLYAFLLGMEFKDLRKTMGYTDAISTLAERHHCDPRTIENHLPKKRVTDFR